MRWRRLSDPFGTLYYSQMGDTKDLPKIPCQYEGISGYLRVEVGR
nr:MAG TPA: hypothetical protein [Crassvirales sp.]